MDQLADLKYEIYIGGTPEKIWEVLTSPEGTKMMYHDSILETDFQPGSPLRYVGPGPEGDKTVHVYGRILVYDPPRIFTHTMHVGKIYNPNHAKFESRVSYQFIPQGPNCTKLLVIHDDWKSGDPSYPSTSTTGWLKMISNLKTIVETGHRLDLSSCPPEKL